MKRFNHRGHRGTQENTPSGSTEVTGEIVEFYLLIENPVDSGFGFQSAITNQQCPYAGFQRRMGLLAAAVSSRRLTRVECGASRTVCGSSSTSSAIDFIASTKRSISSLDSLSVGSIISAPGTISGKAVV